MRLIIATFFLALALIRPAAAQDTEAANRLFVGAVQAWTAAQALTGTDPDTLTRRAELLATAAGNLDRIVADHPGSDLAVKLVIGEKVGPLSLAEAARAQARAVEAACMAARTRTCMFAGALAIARGLDDAWEPSHVLASSAGAQARAGLLTEALATAREIAFPDERSRALASIAAAQADPALLAEALATARGIEDARARFIAPASIAGAQATAGFFAEALATAREIEDAAARASALAGIAAALPG